MNIISKLLILSFALLITSKDLSAAIVSDSIFEIPEYIDSEVKSRLSKVRKRSKIKFQYNTTVRSKIKSYVLRARSGAEEMVARSAIYFPIFEEYLKKYDCPEELKYISVVESKLHHDALSPVGAAGFWQLMPETAAELGLQFNEIYDERASVHRSTEAAVKYLAKQYERFGDWTLAIAAYNCGGGRVRKAIKRAGGSKDYWKIRQYLPKETRSYVSSFIAATYIMEYYSDYALFPEAPLLDLQLTEEVVFSESITFKEIAFATGIPIYYIYELNHSYKMSTVPYRSDMGNSLVLPKRVVPAFLEYLKFRKETKFWLSDEAYEKFAKNDGVLKNTDIDNYYKLIHDVEEGQTIAEIAELYNVSEYNILFWNRLNILSQPKQGEEIIIYLLKEFKEWEAPKITKLDKMITLETLEFRVVSSTEHPIKEEEEEDNSVFRDYSLE